MTGWQVQAMKEAEDARIWEEQNAPDQYEKAMKDAATDLAKAHTAFEIVLDHLADASSVLYETPMQAKIDSFIESLEDIKYDLWAIRLHWERGERE